MTREATRDVLFEILVVGCCRADGNTNITVSEFNSCNNFNIHQDAWEEAKILIKLVFKMKKWKFKTVPSTVEDEKFRTINTKKLIDSIYVTI